MHSGLRKQLKMAAYSDECLRRELSDLGFVVGPITDSTRHIYFRKLSELNEKKRKPNRRSATSPPLGSTRSLLTFSSDESDHESDKWLPKPGSAASRTRLRRRSRLSLHANDASVSSSISSPSNFVTTSTMSISGSSTTTSTPTQVAHRSGGQTMPALYFPHHPSVDGTMSKLSESDADKSNGRSRHHQVLNRRGETYGRRDFSSSNGMSSMSIAQQQLQIKHSSILSGTNFRNNSSHVISMLLVVVVIFFFVMLAFIYMRMLRDGNKQMAGLRTDVENVNVDSDIDDKDRKQTLALLNNLRNKLWQLAGLYDCSSAEKSLKRNMTLFEVNIYVMEAMSFLGNDSALNSTLSKCLQLFIQYPDLGIRLYSAENQPFTDKHLNYINISDIYCLESVFGEKSFFCRIKQAFSVVLYQLISALLVIMIGTFSAILIYFHWLRKKNFQRNMINLTESIINILQKNYEAAQCNPNVNPYLPIVHIRDMLIPLTDRKRKRTLWQAAVKFLQDNDSRIRVECQNVAGEDYEVWRWLQPPSPTRSASLKKLWQGQAFENLENGTNAPPCNLTPCLKVRNMFDSDVECGDDWQIHIQDAILEKCESVHGILHMKVDSSSREGCVYVKCASPEEAGRVFRALHGWWFNGSLVTVRYLRLERYHDRFPEAMKMRVPLQSSNKKSSYGI